MLCSPTPGMDRRLQLGLLVIPCQLRGIKARLVRAESGHPAIILLAHPHQHQSAAPSRPKATSMIHTPAQSELPSPRTSMDLMRDLFSAAVIVAVAVTSPHRPLAPRCRGLRVQHRIKKMAVATGPASLVLLDDLAAGTARIQRPTLSRKSMDTIRCRI